jgi:hypothetical protein
MPQIVMNTNEIAVCPCGERNFEILPQRDFPDEPMAFCVNCQRGKAVSLWQEGLRVGYMMKTEFMQKYAV